MVISMWQGQPQKLELLRAMMHSEHNAGVRVEVSTALSAQKPHLQVLARVLQAGPVHD